MIKKSLNALSGVKVKTAYETKSKIKERPYTIDQKEKVNICLNCTKPASQCKGNCFGNY
jgi:hypothetical protein